MPDPLSQAIVDRLDVCTRVAWVADRRDRAGLLEVFTGDVEPDCTSLVGRRPARASGQEDVDGWAAGVGGLSATQHPSPTTRSPRPGTAPSAPPSRPPTCCSTRTGAVVDPRWPIPLPAAARPLRPADLRGHHDRRLATGNQHVMTLRPSGRALTQLRLERRRADVSRHRDPDPGDAAAVAPGFLHGLREMDVETGVRCSAQHGRQEMPFAPPGFPDRLDGVAELHRQYGGLPQACTDMRVDTSAVHPMADP